MSALTTLALIAASGLQPQSDSRVISGSIDLRQDMVTTATDRPCTASAEHPDVLCRPIEHDRARELGCLALSLDTPMVIQRAEHGKQIIRGFPVDVGRTVDLELTPFSIHGPETRVPAAAVPRPLHLRGRVIGAEDSTAFLSTSRAGTFGWITIGDDEFTLSTGPLSGPRILTCHRRGGVADNAISWSNWSCQAVGPGNVSSPPNPMPHHRRSGPPASCRSMSIALFGDPSFVALFEGDVPAAMGYMETLVAATSEIYEANLNLRLELDHHEVFNGSAPFTITSNMYQNLVLFGAWWSCLVDEQPIRITDAAHLLIGSAVSPSGIAWTSTTCYPSVFYRTGVEGGLTGHFPYPLETQSDQNWDIYVFAHELGHNLGMEHSDAFEPPIDNCMDCAAHGPDAASGPGSIMSFCHLCEPMGMSNIKLEFHPSNVQLAEVYLDTGACLPDCTECPGDLNGDLHVDSADLGLLTAAWGTADSNADIDGDGTVSGADLAYILSFWGATCP